MAPQPLRPGHIIRARGESWVVHRHVTGAQGSVIEVHGHGANNRGISTSFLLPYEPIELLASSEAPRLVRPPTWRRIVGSILANATPSYDGLRSAARAAVAVLPFQLEPVLAVIRGRAARILIADEVGLGKTIQAGLIISELLERRPDAHVLVVTPAGLGDQWHTELRERFDRDATLLDSASIARHAGQWSGMARHAAHWNENPWSVPGVVLTSRDYVKRPEVVRALESLIWDLVVFDEAHALGGRSDRATVASLLARRARTLVLLTATPHSGDDDAFGRLTTLGDFANAFPLLVFRRTRADVGLSSARRTLSLRVQPTPQESEMHRALMAYARLVWKHTSATAPAARLAMTMLTRRACSSSWSLARSLETRLRLLATDDRPDVLQIALPFGDAAGDDEAPGLELSSPGLSDRDEERHWLERVLQLSRLAEPGQSKMLALRRLLRRAQEPAIVFTEYRDTLQQLAHHLHDFSPVQLHGGMTGGERHEVLRRFVNGEARLLLATDAASEGLNLHRRCRLVINLELPWTPVRLEQRIGRVERLGQLRRVHAVHLLAAGTCEEASVAVLLSRMRHVAGVLGGMRAAAYEQQIGEAAIGEGPAVTGPAAASLPSGLVIGDLRTTAIEEAERLELVRRVRPPHPGTPYEHRVFDSRPCVTVLRRSTAGCLDHWAYRLVFENSDLQPLWATVIGIRDDGHPLVPTSRAIRHRTEWVTAHLEPAVTPLTERLLSSLLPLLDRTRSLATERENAIADGLRQQRARLATPLLQPGLFDRRAERAAAAQNATLDEALERCAQRLAELARCHSVAVERRLVFGLVWR
jgi:superfamily II DNA or RNA helicase